MLTFTFNDQSLRAVFLIHQAPDFPEHRYYIPRRWVIYLCHLLDADALDIKPRQFVECQDQDRPYPNIMDKLLIP